MPPKSKKIWKVSSSADSELTKQLRLLHVCGYCSKLVGDNEDFHSNHVKSHEDEITQCRSCCLPMKIHEVEQHLDEKHMVARSSVRFSVDKSLIELRIVAGKSFSSFWGLCLPAADPTLERFSVQSSRWWNRFKNARSIGVFLIRNSKLNWKCGMCENKPTMVFNDTISMRAYALSHLEQFHLEDILQNEPGFFEFEWPHLKEECGFDMRLLMDIAQQRLKIPKRSFRTFYTINLSRLDYGEEFMNLMKQRNRMGDGEVRYCLICCSLIPVDSIQSHFRSVSHSLLQPVAESTSFTLMDRFSQNFGAQIEIKREDSTVADGPVGTEAEKSFKFPEELFLYATQFLSARRDEFKWRCCLCPHAHVLSFATFIVLRMYALRHIEEHHKFIFTKEFLNFEWASLRREMLASFNIRSFTPLQYTIKGENTFNKRDPNDYMLPQQYYFLPMEYVEDTVICGFCFRSLNRTDFLLHISIHGFVADCSETLVIRPVVFSSLVCELMGQSNYVYDGSCDDEPHRILSVDGKRLKIKMDLMNSQRISNQTQFSEFSTPCKSERDTDCEQQTPRSRRSAVDAKRILTETFKILKENARNRRDTWNQSSSSSSSDDDDDSEDERLEQNLKKESEKLSSKRSERPKSREVKRADLKKMKPAEIREWMRKEGEKNGVKLDDDSSALSSSETDSNSEDVPTTTNKWSKMKPEDIKRVIRQAAKRKQISLSSDSSDDSDT